MPINANEVNQIRQVIGSSLKPLLPLAGAAAPQALAIQFGIDLLFRGIMLGFQIKEARELAQAERDKITGGRGLPYWPMPVDTKRAEARQFFVDQAMLFKGRYPLLFQQLAPEIEKFSKGSPPNEAEQAFRVLVVARDVVREVYDTKKFDDDALQAVFGGYLGSDPPRYGDLAREYASLRGELKDDLNLTSYGQLLATAFIRARREADVIISDAEIQAVDDRLQQKVKDLWFNFAFGKDGLVPEVTKFIVGFSKEELSAEKTKREEKIKALQQSADPRKNDRIKAQNEKIKEINRILGAIG